MEGNEINDNNTVILDLVLDNWTRNEVWNDSVNIQPWYNLGWDQLCLVGLFCVVIVVTIIGNTLVILAVVTTRRLRTVTNCFVMSLAVADWLVGVFVMPPAVALQIVGSWELGWVLCDIWISLDVLLCTASILSLCAISVDRYLAVTQPLNYSRRRRSKRLAFFMICIVWVAAAAITCPPIFGWYEPGRHKDKACRYNKNEGYVIFSAMGSFFIPMSVMVYVYLRISCVVAHRHNQLTTNIKPESRMTMKKQTLVCSDIEVDRRSSEYEVIPLSIKTTTTSSQEERPCRSHARAHSFTQSMRTNRMNARASTKRYYPGSLSIDAHLQNGERANRVSSFRRETKTAQTLSIVVGGFIACWLPFFIYYLLMPFLSQVSPNLMALLTWLGWINSAMNPFIYAFYSPDFRIAFWRLTFKHCSNEDRGNFAMNNK